MNETTLAEINNKNVIGILSDVDIKKFFRNGIDIYIDSKEDNEFDLEKQLHVCSVDLHFRHECKRIKLESKDTILSYESLKNHKYTEAFELSNDQKLIIQPGEIILTTTLEVVNLADNFAAIITGRSSIARLGIMVHCCQEFIHPGNRSAIGLQIVNLGPNPVALDLNVEICQVIFFRLATSASEEYANRPNAKYSNETIVKESEIDQEVTKKASATESNGNKTQKKPLEGFRKFLTKYIGPFLPALIMALIITPFITSTLSNPTIQISSISLSIIIGVICVVAYIFIKKGNNG